MNRDYILHPNTNWVWDFYSPEYKLIETAYSKDWVYVWLFEWTVVPQLPFDFDIEVHTEESINELLAIWYWLDMVSYVDGVVTDNRPVLDINVE